MRGVAFECLGAAAAAAALAVALPGAGDPLRRVLVALPLLLVAFRLLERWGRTLGARSLPGGLVAAEGFALLGLFLLALVRPGLGLGAEVPAAGLALVLLVHAVAQALAWRPLLRLRPPHRVPLPFLVLPFVVYLAALVWSHPQRPPDGDAPWYLLQTHSLVEDGDVDLSDDYAEAASRSFLGRALGPQPGDPTGEEGEVWSRHSPFLPLLLTGPWLLGKVAGVRVFLALVAAVLAWRTLALGLRWLPGRAGSVLIAWIAFAFASPLPIFSSQVWVEVPAALLLVLALEALDRPPGPGRRLGLALSLVALPLLKLRFAPIAVGCLLVALRRRREHRVEAVVFLAGMALLLLAHRLWVGNALGLHRPGELLESARGPGRALLGLVGLFLDSSFGLLPTAPFWALLVLGAWAALGARRALLLDPLLVAGPYVFLLVPRTEWFGGWSPPFRYALVFLPVLVPLLALGVEEARRRGARWLLGALATPALLLAALWMALPGWTWNFADGRSHLLDLASLTHGVDVARFFPSTIRPRPATWWWLGVWMALPLASRLPLGRRGRAHHAAIGCGVALALASLLPIVAARVPTRVVELEDPWVRPEGGTLAPERWEPHRVLYPSGWTLSTGSRVVAPIRAGGATVEIRLDAMPVDRPAPLRVLAGETELTTLVVGGAGWREIEVGTFPWDPGTPLVLAAPEDWPAGTRRRRPGAGVVVDRVRLRWTGS